MATGVEFACQDIRHPLGEPDKNPEVVEEIESGPMEVQVIHPINPCGHKWVHIVEFVTNISDSQKKTLEVISTEY